ncbi:N-succinylarginine dihydrolase [Pseudomaricurvus sp.]|uniref:N-succinylarginine dihydrolase n=1 Tax=Pseudomaricurvus sp. TaxID=2004510 RepID=UPI003F6CAD88
MSTSEVNFDGLIGPNHNYSGLAFGNLASSRNAKNVSSPRQAALQGLEKMRTLHRLGYRQGFLPPQLRPDIKVLRRLGFSGSDRNIIGKVARQAPALIPMVYSASSMWAANAATVTPSADSNDGRVHFTPANLVTTAHRAIEHEQTQRCLQTVFADKKYFSVHSALPPQARFADEGAANHTRLTTDYGQRGVGLYVYGRDMHTDATKLKFPARQTLEASEAIARQHGVLDSAVFLQQSSTAINVGAFHNDVVAVGNGPVLFFHEQAFQPDSQKQAFAELYRAIPFQPVCVPAEKVSLSDAITSYLFNSQLLVGDDGSFDSMRLIAPTECRDNDSVNRYLSELVDDPSQPIREVKFVDVRQSMSNGGGPACLRLRVALTDEELSAVHPEFLLDEQKIDQLQQWVKIHYREELAPCDLKSPDFLNECYTAFDELSQLLKLGSYYEFQREC